MDFLTTQPSRRSSTICQRGVQAYLTALPAVSIEAFRRRSEFGPVNQTVLISEQRLDSKSLFLTSNTTTPYTVLYRSTMDGPLVLEIPPEVLGPMEDAWYGSPTMASRGRTRVKAESCCRQTTRARSPMATSLRVPAR